MDGLREVCTDVPAIQFSIYPPIGTIVYCYLITLDPMSILVILIAAYMLFFQINLLQGPKQQTRTNERKEKTTHEGFILKCCH